jgi:hypothetical protein
MLRKIPLILAVILLLATATTAKEGTRIIYGAVNCYGRPVAGARVTAVGTSTYTSRNVVANERGIYIVSGLPADEYIVRALGPKSGMFRPGHRNVFLRKNKAEVNFELKLP